ncbi:hypothetical protein D3C77_170620 [compost metagenome]
MPTFDASHLKPLLDRFELVRKLLFLAMSGGNTNHIFSPWTPQEEVEQTLISEYAHREQQLLMACELCLSSAFHQSSILNAFSNISASAPTNEEFFKIPQISAPLLLNATYLVSIWERALQFEPEVLYNFPPPDLQTALEAALIDKRTNIISLAAAHTMIIPKALPFLKKSYTSQPGITTDINYESPRVS